MIKTRIGHVALRVLCALPYLFPAASVIAQSTNSAPSLPEASQPRMLSVDEGVLLRCDDVVKITVYGEDDLTTETRIEKNGTIRFPLLGAVPLAGRTIGQATEEIRRLLVDERFIRNPQVTLTVSSYAIQTVTILGEVKKPGEIEIPQEGSLDLLGAIALAGGFTDLADLRVIVRRLVNGKDEILEVDARKLAHDSTVKPFYVQPGDTITVRQRIF
ncbi:MAG: polysaccharide export protein [Methylacidiphilales bacterium]|nr:polysaccharide export protein [Candidatus Methylacidiphilales bacterium]